ncbi:hypothetical protein [Pseudomonas sp. Irchel 3A5]|uniref:hypothetical protein n=1 Tax=Pseudomonas sp. Irchel 3A5 TaxID=2008911 RepID=UPI001140028E|nr:hypothetical protein [Pseudomonas sp. Irchel 3A5]
MVGKFPLIETFENSWIVFLGLVFSFFHCRYIGMLDSKAFHDTSPSFAFSNSFMTLLDVTINRGLFFAKWTTIILATSVFYTVIIVALLIQVIPTESVDMPTHTFLVATLYLTLVATGTYITYKHHRAKRYNPNFLKERHRVLNPAGKKLRNILRGLRPNWILLVITIYCAIMTIVLLDRFTDFDVQTSPWRNLAKAIIYIFFLAMWLFGTVVHHGIKRKSEMKKLK